jgi:hypothetical protein
VRPVDLVLYSGFTLTLISLVIAGLSGAFK